MHATSSATARAKEKGKGKARRATDETAHLTEYVDLSGIEHFEPLFFVYQEYTNACGSLELYMFKVFNELVERRDGISWHYIPRLVRHPRSTSRVFNRRHATRRPDLIGRPHHHHQKT